MEISNDHATIYADVVVADHAQQLVLLSMAGPKTAVRAIYASLVSNHKPWVKILPDGGASPEAVVKGASRYEVDAKPLPAIKSAHMVVRANDARAAAGYVFVPAEQGAGDALASALADDPQMALPVQRRWGRFLLERGLETLSEFSEVEQKAHPDAPQRLVEKLRVWGEGLEEAYAYARDFDSWLKLLNEGLQSGDLSIDVEEET